MFQMYYLHWLMLTNRGQCKVAAGIVPVGFTLADLVGEAVLCDTIVWLSAVSPVYVPEKKKQGTR